MVSVGNGGRPSFGQLSPRWAQHARPAAASYARSIKALNLSLWISQMIDLSHANKPLGVLSGWKKLRLDHLDLQRGGFCFWVNAEFTGFQVSITRCLGWSGPVTPDNCQRINA